MFDDPDDLEYYTSELDDDEGEGAGGGNRPCSGSGVTNKQTEAGCPMDIPPLSCVDKVAKLLPSAPSILPGSAQLPYGIPSPAKKAFCFLGVSVMARVKDIFTHRNLCGGNGDSEKLRLRRACRQKITCGGLRAPRLPRGLFAAGVLSTV